MEGLMPKIIEISDSGFIWHVPLEAIATHRAEYYAARDKDTTFDAEFEFVMGDDFEGLDWFKNNMDFEDIAADARLVVTPAALKEPRPEHWECSIEDAPDL